MVGRMLAMVGVVGLLGGAASEPVSREAATTTRYRIESKTEQVVDLSAMGQGNQTTAFTQVAVVSITLTDSAGGKVIHAVLDSITSDAPIIDPSMDPKSARGAWFHGFVDSWGRTRITATSADSIPTVAQLKNTLSRFFPVVKPGSKQGDTWTDTSSVESKSAQQSMKTNTVTKYTRGGTVMRDGVSATRIDATSSTTGAGTMENPMAGTMDVEVKSTGTETFFLAPDGRYLGGTATTDGSSQVRMAMSPTPIPVTVKASATITVLR